MNLPWWIKSRTMWLNGSGSLLSAIAVVLMQNPAIHAWIAAFVAAHMDAITTCVSVAGLVNMYLRTGKVEAPAMPEAPK